jgi:excisionase family DNA binding protein
MNPQGDILTVADAAAELRCSKAHVLNLVRGKVRNVPPLPAIKLGRRTLVRRAALVAWLEANERAGARGILRSEIDSVGA